MYLTDGQAKAAKAAINGSDLSYNTKGSIIEEIDYSGKVDAPCTLYFREWEMLTEACSLRLTKERIQGRKDLEELYELIKDIKVDK